MHSRVRLLVSCATVTLVPLIGAPAPVFDTDGESRLIHERCVAARDQSRTTSVVVRRICRALPELADRDVPDIQAIVRVREWAFRRIDVAGGTAAEDRKVPPDAWRWNASEYLRHFDRDELGVWCGGAAWFLLRVYEEFGIESYNYSFGFEDFPATHVVTVVAVDGKLVLQDAYLNEDIRDASGQPVDFIDALAFLRGRDHEEFHYAVEQPPPTRDVLLGTDPHAGSNTGEELPNGLRRCEAQQPPYWKCRLTDSRWTRFLPADGTLDRLEHDSWPRRIEYLMTYPMGVSSAEDGWTDAALIAERTPTAQVLRDIHEALGLR